MSTASCSAPVGALYLHVPFCIRRCRYCDFATSAVAREDPLVSAYVRALAAVVGRVGQVGLLAGVRTAYVGGGTPTMAGEGLVSLIAAARAACPTVEELSTEANPESLAPGLAMRLAQAGATRVSLGVQSLDNGELAALGRAHDRTQALAAAGEVVGTGMDLSCDLMCGIPLQTPSSWERSLNGVLETGACHVSCYPLILEEGTPLERAVARGEVPPPSDDVEADAMLLARRVLEAAGLTRYEVASYARPGKACAHNKAYWTGVPYLGFGTSAAGMLEPAGFAALASALSLSCTAEDDDTLANAAGLKPGVSVEGSLLATRLEAAGPQVAARVRLRMLDDPRSFIDLVACGGSLNVAVEVLSAREAFAEDLMLGMRTSRGVGPELLGRAEQAGVSSNELDRAVEQVVRRGLACWDTAGRLVPTQDGWLLGNELYGAFWDLA